METNNKKKSINGLPFYALTFLTALLFEFYWILNGPTDYFMLVGIGIIIIITGYLTIDTILKLRADELATRQQQSDTIIKAQKAIYLATKKNAKEAEKTRTQNLKTLEVLMAGMVSSQKELVSLLTSRSEDVASRPIVTADSADMTDLIDKLSQSNEKLAKQVQDAMTIDELVKSNAELVKSVQGIITNAPTPVTTDTVPEISDINVDSDITNDAKMVSFEAETDGLMVDTLADDVLLDDALATDTLADTSLDNALAADSLLNDTPLDDTLSAGSLLDDTALDDVLADDSLLNDTTLDDVLADDSLLDDTTLDDTLSADAPAEAFSATEEFTAETSADSASDDTTTATNSDERDPNAPLSEEEIAALFASL